MKNEKELLHKAWLKSAIEDLKIAQDLFKLKYYSYALFFCHLSLEKILKTIYLRQNKKYPIITHKLAKLAVACKIKLNTEQIDYLNEITTFNIEARYDVVKEKLYKKATKEFTQKYLDITNKLFKHFKALL